MANLKKKESVDVEIDEVEIEVENLPATLVGNLPEEKSDYEKWMEEEEDDGDIEPLYLVVDQDGNGLVSEQAEEQYEAMTVALIKQHDVCKCYPPKFNKNNPLLCCSNDGKNPSCENPLCGPDAGPNPCLGVWKKVDGKNVKIKPCEYGNWNGNEPPRCYEAIQNLILEIGRETFMPYWLEIKSIGLKPLRQLENKLKYETKTSVIKRKKKGLRKAKKCMLAFDISTRKDVRDSGTSEQATFGNVRGITEMFKEQLLEEANSIGEMELNLTPEQLAVLHEDAKDFEEALSKTAHACLDKVCEARVDDEAVAKWKANNAV